MLYEPHIFNSRDSKKGGIASGISRAYQHLTRAKLAKLFNVSPRTISYWIATKRLNPYSIEDIRNKLLHPELLTKNKLG